MDNDFRAIELFFGYKKKLHHIVFLPLFAPWVSESEDLQYLFFGCCFSRSCWWRLFSFFNISWVFYVAFKDHVVGPSLKPFPHMIWHNAIKAMLAEIWFERNQRVFHDKSLAWMNHLDVAKISASF